MSAQAFEVTLARLYTDNEFRYQFLKNADQALVGFDLTADEIASLKAMDRTGLVMAAKSFATKRAYRKQSSIWNQWWHRLRIF